MNIPGTKMLYFSPLIHRYLVTAMILYYGSTRMPKSARMSNLMSVSVMVLLMVILVVFPKEVLIMSLGLIIPQLYVYAGCFYRYVEVHA